MANIEKHGKSLTAEGNVFKGSPTTYNYDDSSVYQGPVLKGQSVKKYNGPPEIQENQKKSDAYEVVSENGDSKNTNSVSDEGDQEEKVVKVGHPNVRAHGNDRHLSNFRGHHRSGLHIVSLDDNDETNDKDYDEKILRDKDLRLYGSIGSPSVEHESRRMHHSIYHDDFLPPSVVSFSQDDFSGPLFRGAGHSIDEFFPNFKRRDSLLFSRPSQLWKSEEIMQQQFLPVNPKSVSFGERPNMVLLPIYSGYTGTSPTVVPFTTQGTFPSSMSQLGSAPIEYSPSTPTANFRNVLEPAFQVPQVQTPSVNPSYILPSEPEEQILFNNQQPDVRSLYSLQAQPQMQIPQTSFPHLDQPQQPMIPSEMQVPSAIVSPVGQREIGPAHRWVDEDGRQRSEVLDRDTEGQDENRSHDDRTEGDEDEEDDDRHQYSRYYDKGYDPSPNEGDDDGAQENLSEKDSEDADEAFSRYQLMSPSSALKENILPKPVENQKPSPNILKAKSDLKISQMSPAEAQFYENKVAMEPNFTPAIASKDTIPGKSRHFRVGLGKVLIRLNGEPLEDSSQLRSKIENGEIIQGKGKLIKSKGPVQVKLSHTKDSKHLKIIDIIAPKQFQVYDTKSKIRRPANSR
ncbi:hypothetical protein pdam_00005987 [Pocillopora damicornis]|uniref:Uncharacterized protein n=1 Tax=Pocillopora damicornis TaxID=46731 RepID=A0A3M6TDB6_POCDA|nr:hypothetical protein pdam_00005987 [Pocillopora damicornis]